MSQTAERTDVAKFIVLEPSDTVSFIENTSLANLKVVNNSPTRNIVFKIRTTAPLCYIVKPNSGIIEAGDSQTVDINYVPNDAVPNVADSKFQVQVAYTDLKASDVSQLPNFYQYLQKSQIQAFKLSVLMKGNMGGDDDTIEAPIPADNRDRKSDVFASAVQQQPQANPQSYKPVPPQFEAAPTSEVNQDSGSDTLKRNDTVYLSSNSGSDELQSQISAYKKMIEREQAEIKALKLQIQRKGSQMSNSDGAGGATSVGAQANKNWEDDSGSSKKKFKFVHVIIVSIVFLYLGSYLAKLPIAAGPAETPSSETIETTQTD